MLPIKEAGREVVVVLLLLLLVVLVVMVVVLVSDRRQPSACQALGLEMPHFASAASELPHQSFLRDL